MLVFGMCPKQLHTLPLPARSFPCPAEHKRAGAATAGRAQYRHGGL